MSNSTEPIAFIEPNEVVQSELVHGVVAGDEPTSTSPASPRPRIRWGAIVWGLIVSSVAIITLAIIRTGAGRERFALWLTELTPGGIWLIVVLVLGSILLLLGLLSALRRLQRR